MSRRPWPQPGTLADAPPYLRAEPIYIVPRSCSLNAWRAIHYVVHRPYSDGILLTPATAHVMASHSPVKPFHRSDIFLSCAKPVETRLTP
ncbi:MAG: hypothetical protein ACRD3K_02405 [Edaphobacter sp.]